MSRDKAAACTLWLVLGTRDIAWGAVTADGRRSECDILGRTEIATATERPALPDLMAALAALPDDWGAGHGDIPLEIFVADRWLAQTILPWMPALMDADGALAQARIHLVQAGFDLAADDVVRLDDAPFGSPRLAVAYPSALLAALMHEARRWGACLHSLLPVSVASWTYVCGLSRPRPAALAMADDDGIVVVGGDQSGNHVTDFHLRARRSGLAVVEDLAEVWRRLCLRQPQWERAEAVSLLGAPAGSTIPAPFVIPAWAAALDSGIPVARLRALHGKYSTPLALDALTPRTRIDRRLQWAVAGTGILAAFLGWLAIQTAQALAVVQAEVDSLAHPVEVRVAGWTREETSRVQAVNAAIRELNLPIDAMLRSLEPPKDIRVAVLSVETSGEAARGRSSLRIVAQTPSSAEMARYVGFVSERKPFVGAYLVRHETVEEGNQRFLRFTVEAQWND